MANALKPYEKAAHRLAHGRALAPLQAKARTKDARQKHPFMLDPGPGLPWPIPMDGLQEPLYQGWRECGVINIQPGGYKTTAFVIPQAAAAPGALLLTSNKIDGVAETVALRTGVGRTIWRIDPQGIEGVPQGCTVNLLRYVHDDVTATELATVLSDASSANNTRSDSQKSDDAHFGPAGIRLVSYAILAAALDGHPISTVERWIVVGEGAFPEGSPEALANEGARTRDVIATGQDAIAAALEKHGWNQWAAATRAIKGQPEKTRGSLWATAARMVQDLGYQHNIAWTTPNSSLPELELEAFLYSKDTLIMLSKKGAGGAGFIVTSLLQALVKQAERTAADSGSRLPVPLVMLLDEICNIVQWPELPDKLSFFGSLGIVTNLFIQGFDQGIRTYGKQGMGQLWKSANIRWLGGGEDDTVLRGFSATVGDYDKAVISTSSRGWMETTTSKSTQQRPILTVAELANMPKGYGLLTAQDLPQPCLAKVQPWFHNPELLALISPDSTTTPTPQKKEANPWIS